METALQSLTTEKNKRSSSKEMDLDGPEGSLGENNWLLECPEALAALDRGIAQSKLEPGVEMSFLQYADLEIED